MNRRRLFAASLYGLAAAPAARAAAQIGRAHV